MQTKPCFDSEMHAPCERRGSNGTLDSSRKLHHRLQGYSGNEPGRTMTAARVAAFADRLRSEVRRGQRNRTASPRLGQQANLLSAAEKSRPLLLYDIGCVSLIPVCELNLAVSPLLPGAYHRGSPPHWLGCDQSERLAPSLARSASSAKACESPLSPNVT